MICEFKEASFMASPIFVSNPNPSFSLNAIVKGIQFAFLGAYRLLQNQFFFENSKYFKFTLVALQISILIQLILSTPLVFTKIFYWIIKFILGKAIHIDEVNKTITLFSSHIFQLQSITLLVVYTLYDNVFEDIFISGLEYIDQVTLASKKKKKPTYSTGLIKCKRVDLRSRSYLSNLISDLNWLSTHQINHLSRLIKSYLKIVSINLVLYFCTFIPFLKNPIVSFMVSRSFNSKLGTSLTFLAFILGLIIPPEILLKFYSFYSMTELTVKYLLNIPYFQRLNFTDVQTDNWLSSRAGLLFGFGSIFSIVAYKFSYISLLILVLEQLSLAYFISQVTDPIPDTLTEPWILTQVYWTRIYNKLTVSSDGFKPIPLSYIISKHQNASPDTSSFVTPISSSTSLNRLNE